MGDSGNDIIIKGGSVELVFDDTVYRKQNGDPKMHLNSSRKITRVVITGDITFDSNEHPEGLSCEIKASCG